WGAPIPIIYCESCGTVPVPDEDLPVLLPRNVEFMPTGESPLALCEEFVNTTCPKCGRPGKRETDTMDTFVDSSWYFLRYCSPRDDQQVFDRDETEYWMPVDQYIGGIEHATMHLIYCRFFTQVLHDLGYLSFDEPATKLFCQGMVCREAHYCQKCKWLAEEDVHDGVCQRCGEKVKSEVAKMSKSKLNTVSPDETMDRLGADTVRLYILTDTPPDRDQIWSDEGLHGAHRLIGRLWTTVQENLPKVEGVDAFEGDAVGLDEKSTALHRKTHETIKRVTENIEGEMHFNTAIAAVIELLNETRGAGEAAPLVLRKALETMVVLLSPIISHIAEELWQDLGHEPSVFHLSWPTWDESALTVAEIELPVQINGKLRGRIRVPADASEDAIRAAALADEVVQKHLDGREPKKVIVVPGRMVNLVG
nr:class I tRNA ligase family protein [PVC group bacterium]